ncbi:MAG: hypothetical protein HY927_07260 [Elusimicrobia bacterium]|nr:hypothetical protein [Elusimicrobiota bacterium]
MMKKSSFFLAVACMMALSLVGRLAQAQENNLDLSQKAIRGSAIVETWLPVADQGSCRMPSVLGLCGSYDGARTQPQAQAAKSKWARGWSHLRSLNMNLTRINVAKAAPNKLFQLVKMFIDDVEVAQIGDFKIKVAISLQ